MNLEGDSGEIVLKDDAALLVARVWLAIEARNPDCSDDEVDEDSRRMTRLRRLA